MTQVESDALRFLSRACRSVTGYSLPDVLRELEHNEEAVAVAELFAEVWRNVDRGRN